MQEQSPAGQPQVSPQLQPVQSPREWAFRLAFAMNCRLQVLTMGLAYPCLQRVGKGYGFKVVFGLVRKVLYLDFGSGSV